MDAVASSVPLNILVVEDDPVDVYTIRWVLSANGVRYNLHVIESGEHALHFFDQLAQQEARQYPDILLLDLNLPQQNGKALLQRVKAIPQSTNMRIVIITGSVDPADRAETLALGADVYFVKSFSLTEFMQLGELIKDLACGNAPER